ncbi:MAG: CDP-glucose 4,6-dehydratase, partial [Desulfovibrionales bacterium]|nr:CDP-glucose 4,6-dehydratase [Desulfovibrionales bacterium]
TGFKGSWLCLWLKMMGANVCGYSLNAPTTPNLFHLANISDGMTSIKGDIRDIGSLTKIIHDFQPEIIIHMAAQAKVRNSYIDPVETYSTNIMGTIHLLDAVRKSNSTRVIINVTSDKCYENQEWLWGYRENDPMGGYDPYSSSKGCSELITSSYLRSFFNPTDYKNHRVALATARAGNVIGGGDFAEDRLVPDMVRAFMNNETVHIRAPHATRPWQHVLEPLNGYLILAQRLYVDGPQFSGGWNFGPDDYSFLQVKSVVEQFATLWDNSANWSLDESLHPHEAHLLKLDSSKARNLLDWKPCLNTNQALNWTAQWYMAYKNNINNLEHICRFQINTYESLQT